MKLLIEFEFEKKVNIDEFLDELGNAMDNYGEETIAQCISMNEGLDIELELENFILYYTSDDKERDNMRKVLKNYLKEARDNG